MLGPLACAQGWSSPFATAALSLLLFLQVLLQVPQAPDAALPVSDLRLTVPHTR